jgi:hypothetical protein
MPTRDRATCANARRWFRRLFFAGLAAGGADTCAGSISTSLRSDACRRGKDRRGVCWVDLAPAAKGPRRARERRSGWTLLLWSRPTVTRAVRDTNSGPSRRRSRVRVLSLASRSGPRVAARLGRGTSCGLRPAVKVVHGKTAATRPVGHGEDFALWTSGGCLSWV